MTNNKYLIAIFLTAALFALPLHADVKRESLHFLTTEAGLGYSALLNKSANSSYIRVWNSHRSMIWRVSTLSR